MRRNLTFIENRLKLVRLCDSTSCRRGNEKPDRPAEFEWQAVVDVTSGKELRVVLLGKTGSGKSSLGNTLLGREEFWVADGMSSGTEKCKWADTEISGIKLQVIDTPGLCDTHRDEEDVLKEVGKSVAAASPGPHVVLVVLRSDKRFTDEEYEAYLTLKKLFGEDIRRHMIIVFTAIDCRGDTLDQQRLALAKDLRKCPANLNEIIDEAEDRYYGVSNTASTEERQQQARELLDMMTELLGTNGGKYFKSDVCGNVDKLVRPMVQERMKKENISEDAATREVKKAIVEDKSALGNFWGRLVETIMEAVLPAVSAVVTVAGKAAVKAAAKKCVLM